jgi:hypothetical protein
MSGSAPAPYKRLVLAPRSVPAGATVAAAAPAAASTAAAPAPARSSIFGAAKPREQVLLEKGIDVQAQERKLDQRTQRLPRMNKSQEDEFKELETLLASATATAASEDASVVRACACVRCERRRRYCASCAHNISQVNGIITTSSSSAVVDICTPFFVIVTTDL